MKSSEGRGSSARARRVAGDAVELLVLSVPGASPDGFAPWLDSGCMPVLRRLLRESSSGPLETVLPTLTPPNWASLWTGRDPAGHRVFGFATCAGGRDWPTRADAGSLPRQTWRRRLEDSGVGVATVFAPLTHPAEAAGRGTVSIWNGAVTTSPPSLRSELEERGPLSGSMRHRDLQPPGGLGGRGGRAAFLDRQNRDLSRAVEAAQVVSARHGAGVLIVHLGAADAVQHALWHGVDPAHPCFDAGVGAELSEFFRSLDRSIDFLLTELRPASVLVFSDHGFAGTRGIVDLASVLGRRGVLRRLHTAPTALSRILDAGGLRSIRRRAAPPGSWTAKRAFATRGRSGLVICDDKVLYVSAMAPGGSVADEISAILESFEDPERGERPIRRVWRAGELFDRFEVETWEVLVLELAPGYTTRTGALDAAPIRRSVPGTDYLVATHSAAGWWALHGATCRPSGGRLRIVDLARLIVDQVGGGPVPEGAIPLHAGGGMYA